MEDGLRGAMLAMLVTSAVNAVLWNYQLRPLLRLRWRTAVPVLWRPAVAAILMGGIVLLVADRLRTSPEALNVFVRLGIEVAVGTVAYLGLLGVFWLMAGAPDGSPEAQIVGSIRTGVARFETMLQFSRRPAG